MVEAQTGRLEKVDVVRWQDGKIYVLGRNHWGVNISDLTFANELDTSELSYIMLRGPNSNGYLYKIVHDATTGEIIEENTFRYKDSDSIILAAISSIFGIGLPWLIHELRPSTRKRGKDSAEYVDMVPRFRNANIADLRKAVKDIRVYQGSLEELSQETGRELERVDTGRPETFIKAENPFWLRVRAYDLGADAVVHYQPSSSIGTPVKFKE